MYDIASEIFDDVFRNEKEADAHAVWLNGNLKKLEVRKVIDAGAGTGEQAIRLWMSGNFDIVIANDLNEHMLALCRKKLKEAGIEPINGWPNDVKLPFFGLTRSDWVSLDAVVPQASIDAIFCLGIAFYHLMTRKRFINALKSWSRMLRTGGYVLIDQPADHKEIATAIRRGSYNPSADRNWEKVVEITGRSGKRYAIIEGNKKIQLPESPLGWRSFSNYIIAELGPEHSVKHTWVLNSGGAILDDIAIRQLAAETGFKVVDLPIPSPLMYVGVQDVLLQKS